MFYLEDSVSNIPVKHLVFENNKQDKLVYYSCPKNANSSVKQFLVEHIGYSKSFEFIQDDTPEYILRENNYDFEKNIVSALPSKQPFIDLKDIYPEYNLKTVCLTRDPLERFISAYKNRILWHKDINFQDYSCEQVILNLEKGNFENTHFLPQVYFLGKNKYYYDLICEVKNIKVFENFVNNFFERDNTIPVIQRGGHDELIDLSSAQIERIKYIYKEDYEFLF